MGGQAGIPLFYLQGQGELLRFRDNFADASEFWAWRKFLGEVSVVGKSGVEATGQYALQVNGTKNGKWDASNNEAPRLFLSPTAFPCEIITRLDDVGVLNDETFHGLFISKRPTGFGATNVYAIGRKRYDLSAIDGICVVKDTFNNLDTTGITTLPIWLRIRIGCVAYTSLNVWFDYSIDGVNWINTYQQSTGWATFSISGIAVGIYVANGAGTDNSASTLLALGKFDYFQMKPKTIN